MNKNKKITISVLLLFLLNQTTAYSGIIDILFSKPHIRSTWKTWSCKRRNKGAEKIAIISASIVAMILLALIGLQENQNNPSDENNPGGNSADEPQVQVVMPGTPRYEQEQENLKNYYLQRPEPQEITFRDNNSNNIYNNNPDIETPNIETPIYNI